MFIFPPKKTLLRHATHKTVSDWTVVKEQISLRFTVMHKTKAVRNPRPLSFLEPWCPYLTTNLRMMVPFPSTVMRKV
jgi:hypothetical protein